MAPPSSAHIRLGDVLRAPIQQNIEGEFRQHDGVVTMLMFYRRRASPKHRYDIIEVDYGGGGHRTRLKDQTINCCVSWVPPAPVYKGARGGASGQGGGAPGGVLLLPGVGLPPFPCWTRSGRREEVEGRKEGGGAPPFSLSYSDWGGRGAGPCPGLFSSLPPRPTKAH